MPLTSVSGMHVTGRLKLSDPPSEGTPRRVTQLSQYGGNLTIVLEVQFHGFHAFFTRVHGHPPFCSRILSAHPFGAFRSGLDKVLGLDVGLTEDGPFWTAFLRSLVRRGLKDVLLVISDAHEGLKEAIRRVFGGSSWQRCRVHFMRNVLSQVPKS